MTIVKPSPTSSLTINSHPKHPQTNGRIWRSNKLPRKWEKLKKSPSWRKLSKIEQQILKLGWPNRHLQLSYSEIATLLNIQRNAAIRLMQKLEKMEFVTKKKSFIERGNGRSTKIHKRNYYVFTEAGKAGIEILLNRLFVNGQNEPQKNLTNVRKNKPSESSGPQVDSQDKKFSEIKRTFEKYSFEEQLSRAYKGTLRLLLKHSIEKIEKILKLIQRKIQKGWKLREFWGFFLKQLKSAEKIRSFFPYLANAYLEAASGKYNSIACGVDSSIIAESLGKLQKTGEIISENKLSRILSYGTQKVKTALEGICYRSYLGRGTLPKPKSERKKVQKSERRPITELVKVNTRTGGFYSEEDYRNGENFSMRTIILGYQEVESPRKGKNAQEKTHSPKIRSWISLLIETLKTCQDCERIHKRFFFSNSDQCSF